VTGGRRQAWIRHERAWKAPCGFERRAFVDGHRRPRLSGEGEFDTIDLLFINAGFSTFAPLESMTEAVYDDMFNLNAKDRFSRCRNLRRITRGGSVVFTTSTQTLRGCP